MMAVEEEERKIECACRLPRNVSKRLSNIKTKFSFEVAQCKMWTASSKKEAEELLSELNVIRERLLAVDSESFQSFPTTELPSDEEVEEKVERTYDEERDKCIIELVKLQTCLNRFCSGCCKSIQHVESNLREELKELERIEGEADRVGLDLSQVKYQWFTPRKLDCVTRANILKSLAEWLKDLGEKVDTLVSNLYLLVERIRSLRDVSTVAKIKHDAENCAAIRKEQLLQLREAIKMRESCTTDRKQVDGLEVFQLVKDTKVLFSFASRQGGLEEAKRMKAFLCSPEGLSLNDTEVYIDCQNLENHRCTHVQVQDGIKKVLNPHWAEFYLFAAMMTHVVIFVVDEAWYASQWCQGENDLFMEHMLKSYFAGSDVKTHYGSEFDLVLAYQHIKSFSLFDDQVTMLLKDINEKCEENMRSRIFQMGVRKDKPISFVDWGDKAKLSEHVRAGVTRVERACEHDLTPEEYEKAAVNLFESVWRAKAIELEEQSNPNHHLHHCP